MKAPHTPIRGPEAYSPEWYTARATGIFASEAAAAIGISEYAQPLDVYCVKLGLIEPFEGNELTDRGKRFEPFIAQEYTIATSHQVETGHPLYFHPDYPFIGATLDGRRADDPLHAVEFKACGFRRAAKLGEEHTDQVFEDWLVQCQVQMFVVGAHTVDLFVMVDLHTYRLFVIERNDVLIPKIVEGISDLWDRIQRRDPPTPDFKHPCTLDLLKRMTGLTAEGAIELSQEVAHEWAKLQRTKTLIKRLKDLEVESDAKIRFALGTAEVGRLPLGQKEIVRYVTKDSIWSPKDIDEAQANQGKVKRKGSVKLGERKIKK